VKQKASPFGLPLLTRELLALAARKRTYVIRMAYAVTLFALVLLQSKDLFQQSDGLQSLGTGGGVFNRLFEWQMLGVFLIMPIITCSAIAHEKERDTLQLLLVTHLGPVTIMLEKLLSRVLVMISMLVMSLPMMAYAFSLGGVTETQIIGGMTILVTTTVYVGSFTLMCSAMCSSTVSAFVCTILLGLPFLGITSACTMSMTFQSWNESAFIGTAISQVFYSVLFFVIGLAFLVERAMQPPKNIMLEMFRGVDRFFNDLNQSTTGGIVLVSDKNTLPNDDPIVWRETHKKSLGTFRYLVRILVVIELPTVMILLNTNYSFTSRRGVAMVTILWSIAMIMMTMKVASIVSGERSRQTLDVLLTTPLSSRHIIIQHLRGVQRLKWVLQLPLFTVMVFRIYWNGFDERMVVYSIGTLVAVFLFFELCAWASMLIGLTVKNQMKSLLLATGFVFGLAILPIILTDGAILERTGHHRDAVLMFVLSPSILVYQLETGQATGGLVFAQFLVYGSMLALIRWFCLRNADRWLGRCEPEELESPPAESLGVLGS
jgi:ABC-type transport system involved in multi-copper enzyme maturation permease subunit